MTPATPESELTPDLIERVMKLSAESQDMLVALLLDEQAGPLPDPDEVGRAWRDVIARRVEDVKVGRVVLVDAKQALAEARQRLRERHGI
jgi:hypothetical protein